MSNEWCYNAPTAGLLNIPRKTAHKLEYVNHAQKNHATNYHALTTALNVLHVERIHTTGLTHQIVKLITQL